MGGEQSSPAAKGSRPARPGDALRLIGPAFRPREYDVLTGESHEEAGRRLLGTGSLVAIGLGGLIGAGIFVTVGMAAHDKAGPAIILSFVVAAAACIAVALCYCECASRVPVAGSAYAYAFAAVGELGAWLSGWNLATCYLLAGAAVSQGWSGYFRSLLGALGIGWPGVIGGAPFDVNPATGRLWGTGSFLDLPALLAIALITFVVCRGMRLSLRVNNLILALKLAVLGLVIGIGLAHFRPENWSPFAPFGWGGLRLDALLSGAGRQTAMISTGMLAGAATVFFAFGGFEMLSAYSDECRRPRRDVPLAVIATIGLLTLLYIAVAVALTGMVPVKRISVSAPISDAFRAAGMPWVQLVVAAGAVAGMTSVLLAVVMSLPRVLMGIGRDGLLPSRIFNRIHPVYGTPFRSVLIVGATAALMGSLLPLRLVMDAVMMATLAGYVAVCAFVLVLRRRPASREPVFSAPFGPVVPVFGIAICLLLMFSLPPVNWIRLGVWWALGLAVYLVRRAMAGIESPQAEIASPPAVAEEAPSPASV